MRPLRRARGTLLRLVMDRWLSIGLGLVLLAPGLWLIVADYSWESGLTDGFGLLAVATGSALLLAGLGGRRPDWIENGGQRREPPAGTI